MMLVAVGPVLGCFLLGKVPFKLEVFWGICGNGFFFTLATFFSLATAFKANFLDGVAMVNGNIRRNAVMNSLAKI